MFTVPVMAEGAAGRVGEATIVTVMGDEVLPEVFFAVN